MRRDICRHGTRLPASMARPGSPFKQAPIWFRFIPPPNEPASRPQNGQRSATNPRGKQRRTGPRGGEQPPDGPEAARFVACKCPSSAGTHLAQARGPRRCSAQTPAEELYLSSVSAPCAEDQDSCSELWLNACSLLSRPVSLANASAVSPPDVSTHSCTATNKERTLLGGSCRVALKISAAVLFWTATAAGQRGILLVVCVDAVAPMCTHSGSAWLWALRAWTETDTSLTWVASLAC
jgi:hypothetical protein